MKKIAFVLKKDIRLLAVLISLLLSLIVLSHGQPSNGDAATYFRTAVAYGAGGFHKAVIYHHWPFFSMLLFYIAKITHLSLVNAGLLLNTLLASLLVWSFISIIKAVGGDYRTQCIAALVILFYPYINHFRDNVLRDMGYWAFYLMAILFLIQYAKQYHWRYVLLWNIAILLAALFRFEGIGFAMFVPLFLLFKPDVPFFARLKAVIKLYSLPAIMTVCVLILIIALGKLDVLLKSSIANVVFQLQSGISTSDKVLHLAAQQSVDHVLNYYGKNDGLIFVIMGLLGIFMAKIVSNLGIVFSVLAGRALWVKHASLRWEAKAIFCIFIFLNLVMCALFLSQHLFISHRYTTGLSLLLLFLVVYSIADIVENYQLRSQKTTVRRAAVIFLGFGLIYNLIAGLGHFGTQKQYLHQAGDWLREHSPSQEPIFSNTAQVIIYTDRTGLDAWDIREVVRANINNVNRSDNYVEAMLASPYHFKYAVLALSRHDNNDVVKQIETTFNVVKVKIFKNNKGDRVIIFKMVDQK